MDGRTARKSSADKAALDNAVKALARCLADKDLPRQSDEVLKGALLNACRPDELTAFRSMAVEDGFQLDEHQTEQLEIAAGYVKFLVKHRLSERESLGPSEKRAFPKELKARLEAKSRLVDTRAAKFLLNHQGGSDLRKQVIETRRKLSPITQDVFWHGTVSGILIAGHDVIHILTNSTGYTRKQILAYLWSGRLPKKRLNISVTKIGNVNEPGLSRVKIIVSAVLSPRELAVIYRDYRKSSGANRKRFPRARTEALASFLSVQGKGLGLTEQFRLWNKEFSQKPTWRYTHLQHFCRAKSNIENRARNSTDNLIELEYEL